MASEVLRARPAVALVPQSQAWIEVIESDFGGFRSIAATMAVGMAAVVNVVKARGVRQSAARSKA
jgi:hypothetical protein